MDKIRKLIKPNKPNKSLIKKVQIYSYIFPNGKIYVGYTSIGLEYVNKCHKQFGCSPLFQYVNNYPDIKPKEEKKLH